MVLSTTPPWITVHDPYGLALIVALACKETGFLLFNLLAILSRPDVAQAFRGQRAAAQALGHGTLSIWLRLFVPQLWPNLKWPIATCIYLCSNCGGYGSGAGANPAADIGTGGVERYQQRQCR